MGLGWGSFFSCPGRRQQECWEPGCTLLCMGLFSRFFVQALPCTAEGRYAGSRTRDRSCRALTKTSRSNSNTSCARLAARAALALAGWLRHRKNPELLGQHGCQRGLVFAMAALIFGDDAEFRFFRLA